MTVTHLSYSERAYYCLSTLAKHLFQLMEEKKTNLALSADVTTADKLLEFANLAGPHICMLKTHVDIIEDFTPNLTKSLRDLAREHHFLLFEDRKFADIGNTVLKQYEGGIYHIADWADIINAHALPGPGVIQGLAKVGRKKNRGLILLAEMSSSGHLMNEEYIKSSLHLAEKFSDFVIGFITQKIISSDPHWINFTPGIKLSDGEDTLGQQYTTPEQAILHQGSDVIIVGRGILSAKDPLSETQLYRKHGWESYVRRCKK